MEEIKYYALTINKNYRKNAKMQQGDYADILLDYNKYITHYTFEIGSIQKRLHLHMLIQMDSLEYTAFVAYKLHRKGFNFKIVECTNMLGWLLYMQKDKSLFSGGIL